MVEATVAIEVVAKPSKPVRTEPAPAEPKVKADEKCS